jgi:predicted lipoprotein with Yx(FWY)xxD motif
MRRALWLLAIGTVALLGASAADDWTPAAAAEKQRGAKLKLKRSPYGRVLFANGYAMYLFTRDGDSRSECRGRCARAWPPLVASGRVEAGKGVKERLIDTARRANGEKQVLYNGHPLYGYVHDPRGEVLCHDVVEFGGTWYAVRKSGKPAP